MRRLKQRLGISFSAKLLVRAPYILWRRDISSTSCINRRLESAVRACLAHYGEVSFLQIGANDGRSNDPLYGALRQLDPEHVRGVVIEPQEKMYSQLVDNYREFPRVRCLRLAIDHETEQRNLYRIKSGLLLHNRKGREYGTGCASFSYQHVVNEWKANSKRTSKNLDPRVYIETEVVQCARLPNLVDELALVPKLVIIDVEGFDGKVLGWILEMGMRPDVIIVEHKHLRFAERRKIVDSLIREQYLLFATPGDLLATRMPVERGLARGRPR